MLPALRGEPKPVLGDIVIKVQAVEIKWLHGRMQDLEGETVELLPLLQIWQRFDSSRVTQFWHLSYLLPAW